MKLSMFFLLLCLHLQETAGSDKRPRNSRMTSLMKNCGKLLLASYAICKPSQTTESNSQALSCAFNFPLKETSQELAFVNCADRQDTYFDKYMACVGMNPQEQLLDEYLKTFPEISEEKRSELLSKVYPDFEFFHVKQGSEFFDYQYSNKAEAIEETLKDTYAGKDFEKLVRMLEYTKVLFPDNRAKATAKSLEKLRFNAQISMDDFDRLVQYSKKIYPNSRKSELKYAMNHIQYLKNSSFMTHSANEREGAGINFDLADQVFPYYKAEIIGGEFDFAQEMNFAVDLATIFSRELAIGAEELDHCLLKRVLKITKKTSDGLERMYWKSFGGMGAVRDALDAIGGSSRERYEEKPRITSKNIDGFEKSIQLFEKTLSHHIADHTKSTYGLVPLTKRQLAYDIAFQFSRDLSYESIESVYDKFYCWTCLEQLFPSVSKMFLTRVHLLHLQESKHFIRHMGDEIRALKEDNFPETRDVKSTEENNL